MPANAATQLIDFGKKVITDWPDSPVFIIVVATALANFSSALNVILEFCYRIEIFWGLLFAVSSKYSPTFFIMK